MHGLFVTPKADMYDTGAGFYMNTRNYIHREVRIEDFIVHFKAGSWKSTAIKNHASGTSNLTQDEWLKKYEMLYL